MQARDILFDTIEIDWLAKASSLNARTTPIASVILGVKNRYLFEPEAY